jgi:hypothetical protein
MSKFRTNDIVTWDKNKKYYKIFLRNYGKGPWIITKVISGKFGFDYNMIPNIGHSFEKINWFSENSPIGKALERIKE